MDAIANWLFREDETLSPRAIVAAGLVAYLILFLRGWLGWLFFPFALVMVVALALLTFSLLRALLPRMERATGNDPVVIWGVLALFLAVGLNAFGLWFLPAIFIGGALIAWRAPELLESVPLLTRNLD